MQPQYSHTKVNNEIELCELHDLECKHLIERELLKNHISYYIRWPKTSIFSRNKDICIICVNDNAREEAENIVRNICDDAGYTVRFLLKRSTHNYL